MSTQTIVEGRFNTAQSYATSMFDKAKTAINDLTSSKVTLVPGIDTVTFTVPSDPVSEPTSPTDSKPTYGNPPIAPNEPAAIVLPAVPVITSPTLPTFKEITLPAYLKSVSLPDFTSIVPTFTLEKLVVPEIVAPEVVPTSLVVSAIKAIEISIADITVPEITVSDIVASEIVPSANEYTSVLNDAIRSKLLSNIQDGGTGLSAEVEAAIFAREGERSAQALQDAIDKTTAQWAKMGFTLPDGLLTSEMIALNEAYLNRRLDTSRDIAIKQAELEQENLKYSIQDAVAIESKMFEIEDGNVAREQDAANNNANRNLEAIKNNATRSFDAANNNANRTVEVTAGNATRRIGVDTGNANRVFEVDKSNATLEFEAAKTTAALAFDVANSNANRAHEASKETITAMVQVYNANLAAFNAQVQKYQAEAEAYKSFVQAMVIEVDVYKAELEGQKLISDINEQAIKLFTATWDGEISKTKLYESQLRASAVEIDYNKSIIERYGMQVQAYTATVNALTAEYNADTLVYRADIDKWIARSDRDIKGADGSLRAEMANVDKYLKDQQVWLEATKWGYELAYTKLKDTAELAAKVASGALAGASASASLGYREDRPMPLGT